MAGGLAAVVLMAIHCMPSAGGGTEAPPSPRTPRAVARAQESRPAASARPVASKRRAPRPRFEPRVIQLFFPNALEAVGPGEPPKLADAATPATRPPSTSSAPISAPPGAVTPDAPSAGNERWSGLVDGVVLEDEIKKHVPLLNESVRTVGSFRGGGFRDARRQLSMVAVMFGVVAEYDGDVRWQRQAAGLRDLLAAAAARCENGTQAAFDEAKLRSQDLADSVRGAALDVPDAVVPAPWPEVAERRQLMLRLEEAMRNRLGPWTASPEEFASHRDDVIHEAQVIAVLARVMQHGDYEFGDDDTYLEYAKSLESYCRDLVEAARRDELDKVQSATSHVNQSCDACHGDYRG